MIVKPQGTTDNFDLSWIQRQVLCWIYFPQQQLGPIYTKGIIKGIVPLSFNRGNSKVMCVLQNGLQLQTKAINLQKRRHSSSIQRDLIGLQIINPAQIIYQLKKRLQQKKIHTYMWNSMIIINPFTKIQGMYDEKVMKNYYQKVISSKKQLHEVQPHIYGFVCNILNNMTVSQKIQMISISGQSGAGKTQTNKQCLKIISYVCQNHLQETKKQVTYLIQQRILNCDNVIQCFGNSKTSKNDNSSRFGKLITQKINIKDMQILHCQVKAFFLQKSRIIHQIHGQRSFHIFYMLIAYCPDNLKLQLGFKIKGGLQMNLGNFNYLSKHSQTIRDQDKVMWNNLNTSFRLLQISQNQKKHIFEIVAAVLHLGNLQFDQSTLTDNQPCQIVNDQLIPILANLIMIDQKMLKQGLVFNKKQIAGQVMYLPMTKKQCIQGRDSIAKALYQNLFLWVVQQLNKKVNQNQRPQKNTKIIKMLDIYGFQVFQHNSFEQLCVNYTNQRIHQIYLDQVFKHQKNVLKRQGLESIIPQLKFTDNTKIIQLLDTSLKSVFNLLDQSCSLNVKDDDFLTNVKKLCEGHENFPSSNSVTLKKCFIVKHTPGDIQYMAVGFRDKNKDFLRQDIVQKFSKSKSMMIGQRFSQLRQTLRTQSNKKFLGFKIRRQVTALMNQMSFNSDMHFIRCIKPNQQKSALTFVDRVCYNQIRYLGVLDTVRMRKDTYHVRMVYKQFYRKYGILKQNAKDMIKLQQGYFSQNQCKEMTKNLLQTKFKNVNLEYLFGIQRIFMKMQTNNYLQAVLKQKTKKITHSSTVIKVLYRNRHKRNQRLNFIVYIRKIQLALRSYLRDIILIKRKNAVKIIQRQWIKRSQIFFTRKKIIPIKAIQKYIKKIIQKRQYHQQYQSIASAKNMLLNMRKTHEAANHFENYVQIKKQFNKKIYNIIWSNMAKNYSYQIYKRLKGFATFVRNRVKMQTALDKAYNRLYLRYCSTLQKYLKPLPYAFKYQNLHDNVLKIQKNIRMAKVALKLAYKKRMVIRIQRCWRKYSYLKVFSTNQIKNYFHQAQQKQKEWKNLLYRNLNGNKYVARNEGMQAILQKFQKMKKDKIILFYYLIDFQIFCNDRSLQKWVQNYLTLTQDCLMKLNPVQFVDISNTHTTISTTSKLYTWGPTSQIQQNQLPQQGKIEKFTIFDNFTQISTVNPSAQFVVNTNTSNYNLEFKDNDTNRQWNTLQLNFVLLNGIVLTMQKVSFTKLNMPQKINQLSCGMGHVVCKSLLKKVYTWGKNNCGQLGTGDYFQTNSIQPRLLQYFYKKRIPVNQVAASPTGTIVLDTNSKIYWFGTNGTIKNVCVPQQCFLGSKSVYVGNHNRYSPVKIISRWSKTVSLIGITLAYHDDLLKNQISLRKKVLESLMIKWSQDPSLINPPYIQSVADHISQRHMPLPSMNISSTTPKNLSNKQIRQKIINDIQRIEQAQRQLLKTRRNQHKVEYKKHY